MYAVTHCPHGDLQLKLKEADESKGGIRYAVDESAQCRWYLKLEGVCLVDDLFSFGGEGARDY